MATSELDEDEDAPGEEDADFDEETPPPIQVDTMQRDRSLSSTSSRPGKRKADLDEQELMEQNPDLYGLRRSVSRLPYLSHFSANLRRQGRARPTRRVVRAHCFIPSSCSSSRL